MDGQEETLHVEKETKGKKKRQLQGLRMWVVIVRGLNRLLGSSPMLACRIEFEHDTLISSQSVRLVHLYM